MVLLKYLKIKLDTDIKIIFLDYQNMIMQNAQA